MTLFNQFIWQQSSEQVEGASSQQTANVLSLLNHKFRYRSNCGSAVVPCWQSMSSYGLPVVKWGQCQKRCGTVGLWDTDSYSCCRWPVSQPFVVKFKEEKPYIRNNEVSTAANVHAVYIYFWWGFFHTSPIPSKLCCHFLSWFGPLVDQSQFTLFWHHAICIWNFGGLHGSVFVLVENSSLYANTYAHLWMKNYMKTVNGSKRNTLQSTL